jgi:hypothetical protein
LGLLQLGRDVEAIISSAYPGFGFGGRNSAGRTVGQFPNCKQALLVSGDATAAFRFKKFL